MRVKEQTRINSDLKAIRLCLKYANSETIQIKFLKESTL